ncbi:MAG: hypothetical protein CMC36_01925 [Flavobacteriaceae bacterium]|nr:hypothetical protein [Flavobacteriaceae bacterium]
MRLIDQSLTTVRALVVTKKPVLGAFIGLFESAIWILAVSQVIKDINDPFLIAAYAFSFAAVTISWCIVPRRKLSKVLITIKSVNPDAYVTTDFANPISLRK